MATYDLARAALADPTKLLDLTYVFDTNTIGWPTEPCFVHRFEHYGMTPDGYFYAAATFAAPEHSGTHMDAPVHFSEQGMTAEQVPLSVMMGPVVVIDFSLRATQDADAMLSAADIERWEAAHGRIPDSAIVLARSGWGRFWSDKKQYLGTDRDRETDNLHFPGFSVEAAKFLLENRQVAAIAIDTASIDAGASKDFPVHRAWLGANKPAFENLANAERLPESGAMLFCAPMKIGKGTGAPTRVFAILP